MLAIFSLTLYSFGRPYHPPLECHTIESKVSLFKSVFATFMLTI